MDERSTLRRALPLLFPQCLGQQLEVGNTDGVGDGRRRDVIMNFADALDRTLELYRIVCELHARM